MTPAALPATLRRFAALIDEVSDERTAGDGYWVYLAPGYWSPEMESHTIHEETLAACAAMLRGVEPEPAKEAQP